ncbi:MAG: LysM peptidoglycan-binding domain-containing protein [Candidatus Auribacter fodinae]|jgi:lipoprotein-anchoring transpeptidase ErfK/SrfK|uniref:LysM peptidoglycan-binding domain-containing protein n=1 Tax=Candidatus Auribacter fodinae TaxID=2093366 RepID=A0A3A4R6A1_9BACT|nr:MAG: LysM peptidoglycan-binding domain-containing protein [Candidatus Auribacter fodinae]
MRKEKKSEGFKKAVAGFSIVLVLGGILFFSFFLYKRGISKRYEKAVSLYQEKIYAEALPLFVKLKETHRFNKHRINALYYSALAQTHVDNKQAKELWQEILDLPEASPEWHAEALFNLGRIEYEAGNIDKAGEIFQRVISAFPSTGEPFIRSLYYVGMITEQGGLGSYLNACSYYDQALAGLDDNSELADAVKRRLGELNMELFLSPVQTPESEMYSVQPGDSLALIAQHFNTTVFVIKESNRLTSNFIRPNDRLKVPVVNFSIVINKKKNTLTLLNDGKFFKLYDVGTGKYNKTPVGTFKIINKIAEPVWYKPDGGIIPYGDPDNLLGTHWMGINFPGYGIHGTWDEQSIGKQSSAGCVRLINSKVEELFNILPLNTEVVITDN